MNTVNWQGLAIFAAVAIFLGFRFLRFRKVGKALPELLRGGALLVDVRSPQEFAMGHNPISVNVPLSELAAKLKSWDPSRTVILCCASGTRSGMGAAILRKAGFRTVLNAGPWTNTIR